MVNLKKTGKKQGVQANRLVVRPVTPWYYYLVFIVVSLVLLAGLAWGLYKADLIAIKTTAVQQDTQAPRTVDSDNCLQHGSQELCTQLSTLRRQLQMNTTIHENLNNQVVALGEENSRLKEELAFFQHLMSGSEKMGQGVSIYRFNLMNGQKNNTYRYSLSLAQGGRRPKNFTGHLKFSVNFRQNDQRKTLPLTSKNNSQDFPLQFKFFHRLEENFQVPSGAIVDSLQVQVFEKNVKKARLTQTVKLSP